jgi:murein L,D-transpeptidase YcbB/YkuD
MIKNFFVIPLTIICLTCACKNRGAHNTSGEGNAENDRTTPQRDHSINKGNAYNDLFLDSMAVEKFIISDSLQSNVAASMREFYNARNYEFTWFASKGLIEQAASFHSLYSTDDSDEVNRALEKRMDYIMLVDDSTISGKEPSIIKTELQLTEKFLAYAVKNYKDMGITPTDLASYVPAKKITTAEMATSVLATTEDNKKYAEINEPYRELKSKLKLYYDIVTRGGWPSIVPDTKKYVLGASTPSIRAIKKRLQVSGELAGNDSTIVYTPELDNAIKTYQQQHGFNPKGGISPSLIKELNVPALAVEQQVIVNMQRMRWMPVRPEGKLIIVNIPEFELYVDSGKTNLFHMDVVVGREGHNTTMFTGKINQIVFSPYWDVPPSIVKKEILPGMARDRHYLDKKDMEITGHEGGLPVVRQRPGDKNALGKVKFLFPNSFNIYLHDSPEKDLFKKSERDLSHGCIRLSDPVKMANYLLQHTAGWTPQKIDSAMNAGEEQFVKLRPSVRVIITYYTAWIDDQHVLHFADDIYNQDGEMAAKMFTNPQVR